MRVLLAISMLLLVASVPYAAAHPFTLETSPSSAINAPVGITEVYVTYSESIELDFSSLKVFDNNGDQIDNRDTQYHKNEESLVVTTPPLQEGVYTVASKVLSRVDGHLVPDTFIFAVGDIKLDPAHLDGPTSDTVFLPEAGVRFPGLVGQTVVLGAVIASLLIWGTQDKRLIRTDIEKIKSVYHSKFSSVTGVGLILVVISNITMMAVQAWRLESPLLDVIQTTFGTTWLLRMIITAALLGAWFWMERKKQLTKTNQILILALSLGLIATTTLMGHGAASEQTPAVVLDYVHNLVAAVWIGGIVFFAFVLLPTFSRLESYKKEGMSLIMIPRFSIAFVIAVGIVIITGPTLMWFLESDIGVIADSTYGKLIMAKIAIAAAMVGLGGFFQLRIQKSGEQAVRTKSLSVHGKMQRSLRIDAALGVILLGVVALLVNGTLPAGEIQRIDAQEVQYGFETTEFSGEARFDMSITPFSAGDNSISVSVSDPGGGLIHDLDWVKAKVSNPEKNIAPIEVPLEIIDAEFVGEIIFGFSGTWQVELEAHRTENANESVILQLLVKPRLADLKLDITEYVLPEEAKPLYPLYDGKDSIWISDPSAPRLWKFDLNAKDFESFPFEGVTSMWLTKDGDGRIWFTDAPGDQIGFIEPATGVITTIGLPEIQPVIYKNIPTFIQADHGGNIWVVITNKNLILKYDHELGTFEEVRLPDKESLPFALAIDDDGKIWFTDSAKGSIGYIDQESNKVNEFAPENPLLSPESLLFDESGGIWVAEHTGSGIVRFDTVLETFERVAVPDEEALPYGMSFDRYGNIWIALHTVDNMAVYDPHNNTMLEVPIPTATPFVQFTTTDDKDNVWFVEQQGNKLAMITETELPIQTRQPEGQNLKYTEIASPLIAAGIIATSLFYVKNVKDKRRLNELIND